MSEDSSTHSGSPSDSTSPTLDDVSQDSSRQSTNEQNSIRKVYFPEEETDLVTGYLEPPDPWQYAQCVTQEELISRYKSSCLRHGSEPLPRVLELLKEVDVVGRGKDLGSPRRGRSEVLDLKGERLMHHHCEPLEEVLKRLQFDTINLEDSFEDDEASVAIFDMVEYYEAAKQLNISSNNSIGPRGWQACSQMLKKTRCLEKLVARNTNLSEQLMPALCRGLRIGTNLQILHLENCSLSGRSVTILVSALKTNSALKELHLADNGLGVADAFHIGELLRVNSTLQLLDVSNNCLQDKGVGHICDGLVDQAMQHGRYSNLLKDLSGISGMSCPPGAAASCGLSILVLWNNQLTKNCAFSFYKLIANSKTLDTVNVGRNMLTSDSLLKMKEALQQSHSLERLGLQSTCISCEGAIALAECIAVNTRLKRIDLRDNPIQIGGLMALARSMKAYTGVTRLDLDDMPKKKLDGGKEALEQYLHLVEEIRGYSARNARREADERKASKEEEVVQVSGRDSEGEGGNARPPIHRTTSPSPNSRKISLTCETLLRSNVADSGDGGNQRKGRGSCLSAGEPRRSLGLGGRLRSPAPSPVPSPSPSPTPSPHSSPVPSPSRSRFQVSRVPDSSAFFLSTPPHISVSSLPDSPEPSSSPSSIPSRFKVTRVSEPKSPMNTTSTGQGESGATQKLPTVITSSTSNVTIGFNYDDVKVGQKDFEEGLRSSGVQLGSCAGDEEAVEEGWNFDEPTEKDGASLDRVGNNVLHPDDVESGTSVDGISGISVVGVSGNSVAVVSGTSVSGVSETSVAGVSGTSVAGVSGTSVAGVIGTFVDGVSGTSVDGISGTSVDGISGTSVSGVSETSVAGVSGTYVTGVSGTSVAGVSETSVAGVSGTSVAGVSETSVAGVSETSVAGVSETSVAGVSETSVAGVSETSVAGVSETSVDGEQTSNMSHPSASPSKLSPYSVTGRIRKFSSIIPPHNLNVDPDTPKNPTSLERLLGLFQHPSSIFSKSLPNPLCTQNGASQSSVGVGYLFGSPSAPSVVKLPSTQVQPLRNVPSTTKSGSFGTALISNMMQEVSAFAGECRSAFPGGSHDSKSACFLPGKHQCPSSKRVPGEVHSSLRSAFQGNEECHHQWLSPERHKANAVDGDGRSGELGHGVILMGVGRDVVPPTTSTGASHWCSGEGDGDSCGREAPAEVRVEASVGGSMECGSMDTGVPLGHPFCSSHGHSELFGTCCHFPDPNCNTYNVEEVDNMEAVKRNNEKAGGGGRWAVGAESVQLDIVATCLEEGSGGQEDMVPLEAVVADSGSIPCAANALAAHLEGPQE